MQCACIEFAKNVLKIKSANSTEFKEKTKNPVINLMEDQKSIKIKGGTMRLGSYKCKIRKNSIAFNSYRKNNIEERHRHRYEFNNKYLDLYGFKKTYMYFRRKIHFKIYFMCVQTIITF